MGWVRAAAFAIALFVFPVAAATGQVRVVDGDTLEIGDVTYRINGIDALEHGQTCQRATAGTWPCGKAATEQLEDLVAAGAVTCKGLSQDGYDRTIADSFAGDINLGRTMVRTGYAWAFVRYSDIYAQEEAEARRERVGIWQGDALPAWEYRAERWAAGDQEAPEGCPIKGNISRNGRIYHAPWSP